MDTISKTIELAQEQFEKEYGKDAKLEDGDEFVTVFNDAVLIIGFEDKKLSVKISAGKPYFVDFDLDLLEKNDDRMMID